MAVEIIARKVVNLIGFRVDQASVAQAKQTISKMSSSFTSIGRGLSLAITAPLAGIGLASIGAAADVQALEIAFTTMLGSGEKARKMIADLTEFGVKTPFTIGEVEINAKQLLAMGIEADKLLPTMKALGDVSAGLNVPLSRLALNFGQVRAQGKLTGREIRDFAVAGVPIVSELAKMLGVTEVEISDLTSAGKISFDQVEKAFIRMTSEGGRFNNLMSKFAEKTLKGLWSNFIDSTIKVRRLLGKTIIDTFQLDKMILKLTDTLNKAVDWFAKLSDENRKLIILFVAASLAAGPLAIAIGLVGKSMLLLGGATLPVTAAVLALSAAFVLLLDDFLAFKRGEDSVIGRVTKSFQEFVQRIKDIFGGLAGAISGIFTGEFDKAEESFRRFKKAIGEILLGTGKDKTGKSLNEIWKESGKTSGVDLVNSVKGFFRNAGSGEREAQGGLGGLASFVIGQSKSALGIGRDEGGRVRIGQPEILITADTTINLPVGVSVGDASVIGDTVKDSIGKVLSEKLSEAKRQFSRSE